MQAIPYQRRLEPRAADWRSFAWDMGVFDMARRRFTPEVEGTIHTPQHLVMVTLAGGAERLDVISSCGHRHDGPDRAGAVSFVPAQAERRLRLRDVASEWASISLSPALFAPEAGIGRCDIGAFTNAEDGFVRAMVTEFARLHAADGGLDPGWCDAMGWALARYLARRYGVVVEVPPGVLTPWRLRRVEAHVEAHLAEPLRVAALAALVGLSPGYFQRAFRATTGRTPLEFVTERRVRRAARMLREGEGLAAITLRVGFASPSHFSRTFRQVMGVNPSRYRGLTCESRVSN